MQRVYNLIRTVAPASSTVLVTGESGTGKERVAEAIHRRSSRRAGPLIRVNCSAFAEGVLESELFGHEQGAFTGAVRGRVGVFRKADHGTLFLDEIGDLPQSTQVKLLRAIQEREVQPVGGDSTVPVDVRLVAATNRDLSAEVKAGRFREDLFFRLNVIPIHLPALRERPDDIPPLAEHFLAKFAAQSGKTLAGFTDRALSAMERYGWPGNVRELENAIERAVVLAQGGDHRPRRPPARGARRLRERGRRLPGQHRPPVGGRGDHHPPRPRQDRLEHQALGGDARDHAGDALLQDPEVRTGGGPLAGPARSRGGAPLRPGRGRATFRGRPSGRSSVGRASASQAEGREFKPRRPLQNSPPPRSGAFSLA